MLSTRMSVIECRFVRSMRGSSRVPKCTIISGGDARAGLMKGADHALLTPTTLAAARHFNRSISLGPLGI
jgi:hypothetical protein